MHGEAGECWDVSPKGNMLLSPDWIPAKTRNEEGEQRSDQATVDDEKRRTCLQNIFFMSEQQENAFLSLDKTSGAFHSEALSLPEVWVTSLCILN